MLLHLHEFPRSFVLGFLNPRSITDASFGNPRVLSLIGNYNRPRAAARRVAGRQRHRRGRARSPRPTATSATGGRSLGLTEATLDALMRPAVAAQRRACMDVVLHIDSIFSLGYVKPFPRFRFGTAAGPGVRHPGRRRLVRLRRPRAGVGFAYAMNRTGFRLYDDPRELALRDALYRSLGERPQGCRLSGPAGCRTARARAISGGRGPAARGSRPERGRRS